MLWFCVTRKPGQDFQTRQLKRFSSFAPLKPPTISYFSSETSTELDPWPLLHDVRDCFLISWPNQNPPCLWRTVRTVRTCWTCSLKHSPIHSHLSLQLPSCLVAAPTSTESSCAYFYVIVRPRSWLTEPDSLEFRVVLCFELKVSLVTSLSGNYHTGRAAEGVYVCLVYAV